MILIWSGWYSSRADNIQLKQMILIWRGRYSSRADDSHPMETIFIQKGRISSLMVDYWNNNQPLEMIFNHWGWDSPDIDDVSSALDEYIICRKWIFQKIHLDPNYLPRKISNINFYDNRQKPKFFEFITPNLELLYYLWLLIIKMESSKYEKLYRGAGKCVFQIISRRWISSAADVFRKSFFGCIF
jgi:hypothetical protein